MNPAVRHHAPAVIMAVLAATTLVACTSPAGPGSDRPKAEAGHIDPANRPELSSFYQQKLTWTACGDYECAELTVPMDYAHPAKGKVFVLPVARAVTAKPAERIGSVIANPGGPGASGVVSLLKEGMTDSFTAKTRARFDIVSFDPRGVGGSLPALTCGADAKHTEASTEASTETAEEVTEVADPFFPKTAAERSAVLAAAKEEADACAKHSAGILRHVGTEDVARDMDVLRAALGESQVTYLGWSYGTSLGTSYAEQFPRRVRAMVLDGAVDPSLDWSKRALSQGAGFQRAVADYAAYCADIAGDSCPGDTPEKIRTLIDGLFEKTTRGPLPVDGEESGLDSHTLLGAIVMAMYTPETQWKGLSEALADAGRGNGTKLSRLAESEEPAPQPTPSEDTRPSDNESAVLQAVNCFDTPHPREEQEYWKALAPAETAAGRYGTSNVIMTLTCKDWPTTTRQPHRVEAEGVAPVLVVGTTGDAATPYEEATSLASQFPGGMLLTYEGLGHTAYGRSNVCVTNHVDDYLIERKPVPSGTTC
ncbi:alpha/beta hydrolase [Streptomyces sp. AP-93]|uniref:alpha/beta hydrolase n=1 Tax=Streptomyces sp. AP-93 TaxID=2929048 RepID=UPI001FAFA625|nr:alpha/beta hydrolase [Streptomyces sp. AP-93]MCJ0873901.1 alpha/beta hydrolase [Streptomyces sp. AP-93]